MTLVFVKEKTPAALKEAYWRAARSCGGRISLSAEGMAGAAFQAIRPGCPTAPPLGQGSVGGDPQRL